LLTAVFLNAEGAKVTQDAEKTRRQERKGKQGNWSRLFLCVLCVIFASSAFKKFRHTNSFAIDTR